MPLDLLIFGSSGQLARALKTRLDGHRAVFVDRKTCELSQNPAKIKAFLTDQKKPDAIIIAAAYTAVDTAQSDEKTAFAVNADAPTAIAQFCAQAHIPLVHISTDYVFDGTAHTPYKPDAKTNPLNVYGASKLAGERGILATDANAIIVRTSWVFDGVGKNFFTTMLNLAKVKSELDIVDDQKGRPTYAGHLADGVLAATTMLCETPDYGRAIFHVTGGGTPVSWAGFAAEIFKRCGAQFPRPPAINKVPTSHYKTAATRPAYSVLDIHTFEQHFDRALPNWTDGIEAALKTYSDSK